MTGVRVEVSDFECTITPPIRPREIGTSKFRELLHRVRAMLMPGIHRESDLTSHIQF
jgi:hypothetical protein